MASQENTRAAPPKKDRNPSGPQEKTLARGEKGNERPSIAKKSPNPPAKEKKRSSHREEEEKSPVDSNAKEEGYSSMRGREGKVLPLGKKKMGDRRVQNWGGGAMPHT